MNTPVVPSGTGTAYYFLNPMKQTVPSIFFTMLECKDYPELNGPTETKGPMASHYISVRSTGPIQKLHENILYKNKSPIM